MQVHFAEGLELLIVSLSFVKKQYILVREEPIIIRGNVVIYKINGWNSHINV